MLTHLVCTVTSILYLKYTSLTGDMNIGRMGKNLSGFCRVVKQSSQLKTCALFAVSASVILASSYKIIHKLV